MSLSTCVAPATRAVQGYLIVTSVVTAFVFSHIPAWTTWCLLIAMALYDLYAVLTPGGPLKVSLHLANLLAASQSVQTSTCSQAWSLSPACTRCQLAETSPCV